MRGAPPGHARGSATFALPGRGPSLSGWTGFWIVLLLLTAVWTAPTSFPTAATLPSKVGPMLGERTAGHAPVSANWSTLNETHPPSPRAEATFTWANFSGKPEGVLFGGRGNFSVLDNDTWVFTNGTWHQLFLAVHPAARRGAMAAFDPVDGYLVLFGGSSGTAYMGDTWVFNGSAWSELFPPVSPAPRRVGGFAWDGADGYLLLFSGHNGTSLGVNANFTTIQDTWTFVHGRWTELFPTVQPLGRSESSEEYDPSLGAIVLFGGYTTQPAYLAYNDTWMFLAGVWTPVPLSVAPSPRDGAPMAFDPILQAPVLQGGQNESGNFSTLELNDTWVLLGNSPGTLAWQPVDVAQPPVSADSAAMIFDPQLSTAVLFGGHSGAHTVVWFNATYALTLPVEVTIVANHTGGAGPLSFNFSEVTSGGIGPYTYQWNFGDHHTATGAAVVHPYLHQGVFNVTLNATDSVGDHGSSTLAVTAYHRLRANLTESAASVDRGTFVAWNVSATGGWGNLTYTWSGLPPGCSAANQSVLSCAPTTAGTYGIAVNVTDTLDNSAVSEQNLTVLPGSSTPGNSTPLAKSKFPVWIFAAGGVLVLGVVLAIVLWRRERAQQAAKPRAAPPSRPPGGATNLPPRAP
ncbi:MAG: PKD domain-containing protein [Thermoplasmata archaeon]|nr:PKD domain-containing protein [Thermoplasmata archaeon]